MADNAGGKATVVAIPHEGMSHEPFAVIDDLSRKSEDEIKRSILGALGAYYVPARLLTLREIGLNKVPVNATHKIVKPEVQRALIRHLNKANDD